MPLLLTMKKDLRPCIIHKDEGHILRGTTLIHSCPAGTSADTGNCLFSLSAYTFTSLYPGAVMGAPIAAYATYAVGAKLQDHLPFSSPHFFSPTEALFAVSKNVLFFSLPFLIFSALQYKTLFLSCQTFL